MLDYIRYKQLNWCDHVRRMNEERLPRKILEWCPVWKKKKNKKEKTSKFVDAGSNNWNETKGNYQHEMYRQGRMEQENKTLGIERQEIVYTL